jgi:hypothetical protein
MYNLGDNMDKTFLDQMIAASRAQIKAMQSQLACLDEFLDTLEKELQKPTETVQPGCPQCGSTEIEKLPVMGKAQYQCKGCGAVLLPS